ncbi:adenylate kinase 7-like [Aulostomus maculatus]
MGDKNQRTRSKRVFVNDADGYSSRHIAESPSRDELLERLLECDVVVYNISENATQEQIEEATWAITTLHSEMESFKSRKMFILVSTVMTWALIKPQTRGEPEVLPTEEEYRQRRPHPKFMKHYNLEKLVLKLGRSRKSKLHGWVVAAGLQYGKGENLFHYFFKVSWLMQLPEVPIFGQGENYIPMIHVYDLAGVIQNLVHLKPKSKYILAVDDSKNTLEDIVMRISDVLGPGKMNKVAEQEATATKAFKPEELEYLGIDLRLDALIIKDSFELSWVSEAGIFENMEHIVEEYKDARQLCPIRVCLVGPPAVGKTTVAEKLCAHYRLHHITIKDVVEEKITQLKEIVNGEPEHVSEEEVDAAREQLENFIKRIEMNTDQLVDHQVVDILQEKLSSKLCMNQGFVLDGFPETYEQAKLIFSEHVFALNASDDFLTKRVQGLQEDVVRKTCKTQGEFLPRLVRFRQLSGADETVLDYFDVLEIHPEHIEVSTDDPEYTDVLNKITEMVGVPRNYGLSPEDQEEENRRQEEERKQKLTVEAAERTRRNEATLAEMAAQFEEWQKNLSEVRRQEEEQLEARALPLRNYLMKYVMPSLTTAMLECSQIKPEDPVDFLAEHLLRGNQQD